VLSAEKGYELVRCRACGMLYTHSVQTLQAKILYYDSVARERIDSTASLSPAHYGLANQIKSVRLYEKVLQFIAKAKPAVHLNLVDTGCAGGLFLLAAQAIDGYHCNIEPRIRIRGISIDPRERIETERTVGCEVLPPDEAAEKWAEWADVITLLNVLEHVSDASGLLSDLRRILKPDGLLIIDVPNNSVVSLRGRLLKRWPELELNEHINHFIPASLDRLMKRSGFVPVKRLWGMTKGIESQAIPLGWRAVARWLGSSALMAMTLRRVQVFPHMTIVYRKGGREPTR
jgi:SAM-dependent methyltransferase